MNDNGPEIIGSLFEKCNNSNYNLRSNGKFLNGMVDLQWDLIYGFQG
jgi:hypothetical protein